jgi:hypothetical protein
MGDLGAADALLRGARAALLDVHDECWALAEDGRPIDRALQARASLAASLHNWSQTPSISSSA